MRHRDLVKYWDGELWRLGILRSIIADFPRYYAIFLVKDLKSGEDLIKDSRKVTFVI